MYQSISASDFTAAFHTMNRADNFSHEGLLALFDMLESIEEDTGTPIELDVIALCCEFSEYTIAEAIEQYDLDTSDSTPETLYDDVVDALWNTCGLLIQLDNGDVIVQDC